MSDDRQCTCHPDDNPPVPCAKQYALTECREVERLRLAVQLDMHVTLAKEVGQVFACATGGESICLPLGTYPLAATCRAITRAAADIGKGMK